LYQEAMIMRGKITEALESFEAIIAEQPGLVAPRLRAAEHYARGNRNPTRAAELFREVRAIPDVPVRDAIYSSSRLVDLYDGPLADPGRALVELRQPDVHRIRQVRLLILPPAEHLDHLRVLLGDQALKRLAIHFQPVSAAARQGRCATLFARLAAGNAWRMRRSMEPALNVALVAILLWRRGASRRARQRAR